MDIQGVCQQKRALSSTERTPIIIQFCLRSRIGLWESIIMYYYIMFDIMHYFASGVGFTHIVVWSNGKAGSETKYGLSIVRGQCR